MIPVYVLSIIALIVWVLYLHNVLRTTRAKLVIAERATDIAVDTWKGNADTIRRMTEAYASLNNRYNTMEETFLHNERQLKVLTYELRIELDVVKTERDQFGIKLTESESKLYKLQEELESVLLHYNP